MKLRLAVLDMVGTTVQAGDEVPTSFRGAFRSAGLSLSDEAIAHVRGRSKREAIIDLLTAAGGRAEDAERVYGWFLDSLRAAYRTRARPIQGAEDTFKFLRQAGVAVVLVTGLDRETANLLVDGLNWDLLQLDGVLTGDDVSRGRPAPDLIEAAMALTDVEDPQLVLVVGDTTSDLDAAAAARVGWSVAVLSGAHGRAELELRPHSALLDSVADLPRWMVVEGPMMK